jgi:nucleoside-diphosphate-sugar epimerase
LLTGATGYLGGLIAATLLTNDDVDLVLPVRRSNDLESLIRPIRAEIEVEGGSFTAAHLERIHSVELPQFESLHELDEAVHEFKVDEIIHCAGCLDYFDRATLEAVNVNFTRNLLTQGHNWNVRRFTYISTAFSSGYVDDVVPEQLHAEPTKDPTYYTQTKREAERLVANSGLAFLIIRPSIVIGHSRDGHYSGKQYGLYQLWAGMERLLCRTWHRDVHAFAPQQAVSMLHQDDFQKGFLAAFRMLPDDSILNLVPEHDSLPELRTLWQLWTTACLHPRFVYYYHKMSDIPVRQINSLQRALLGLASVNLEIASHPWRFETTNLAWLQQKGLDVAKTTAASVAVCQRRFIEESEVIEKFMVENAQYLSDQIEFIEVTDDEVSRAATPAAMVAD